MAKIDKTKEEISWMKLLFTIFFATYISLAAFVLKSRSEYISVLGKITGESLLSESSVFYAVMVAITPLLFIAGLLLMLTRRISRKINELGEL